MHIHDSAPRFEPRLNGRQITQEEGQVIQRSGNHKMLLPFVKLWKAVVHAAAPFAQFGRHERRQRSCGRARSRRCFGRDRNDSICDQRRQRPHVGSTDHFDQRTHDGYTADCRSCAAHRRSRARKYACNAYGWKGFDRYGFGRGGAHHAPDRKLSLVEACKARVAGRAAPWTPSNLSPREPSRCANAGDHDGRRGQRSTALSAFEQA